MDKSTVDSPTDHDVKKPSRRAFLQGSGLAASSAVVTGATLATLSAHTARANGLDWHRDDMYDGWRSDYGEVKPTPDLDGNMILALPPGFQYTTFSRIGDLMSDGNVCPRAHDGMTCFDWFNGRVRLIRNHEVRAAAGSSNNPSALAMGGPVNTRYDPLGVAGTVTLEFDLRRKKLVRDFISLNGTVANCSGGLAWRNTGWITSEETTVGPNQGYGKKHGYFFFVPPIAQSPVPAVPLPWMGRFAHEGAVADRHGVLYETEDAGTSSGFYRATPNNALNLWQGGALQMLAIKGTPQANLVSGRTVGERLPVEWVTIDQPDPDLEGGALTVFRQGFNKGGAMFSRLEGLFIGLDGKSVYFVASTGGEQRCGQLWHYVPADGKLHKEDHLVLVFESPSGSVLDSPDNICITPRGGILFCEDDATADADTHPLASGVTEVNRLIGMGGLGEPFVFAVNIHSDSEFAGACFSPDGSTLFVNLYGDTAVGSGLTCAIWGPWSRGPL